MGTQQENFALRWNDFQANISSVFKHLRSSTDFQDVTLVSGSGDEIRAHKVILSACSPYFQSIFRTVSSPHPVIVMPHDVQHEEMMSIVDFMYYGEVGIPENEISRFLTVAEQFQVRGLVEDVPKVGAVTGPKRPRVERSEEWSSYQPLGSYQPPGLVCPKCRTICRDGPQGLAAHMAQCGQERPVLQVAPSRQRGQTRALRGRGGVPARRGRETIKPRHGEVTREATTRTIRRGQGVKGGHGGQGGVARPNLREIGQKLGLAVSITSVAGQSSQPESQPEVKQEPGEVEEGGERDTVQTAQTEQESQYPEYPQEGGQEEETGYESQFNDGYQGPQDLGEDYIGDGENFPGYEDYDEGNEAADPTKH